MQQDDTLEIVITKGKLTKKIALDEIEWYEKIIKTLYILICMLAETNSLLLRRPLIQEKGNKCIKYIRNPYRYHRRHIAVHCESRRNGLEQDIRKT